MIDPGALPLALPPGLIGATVAAIGLIFGSFANVCIHRVPAGESVVAPRSKCPSCGALIPWHGNIPLLSWLWLRARCRSCRAPISAAYPLVEGVMGAGFLAAYLKFGLSIDAVAAACLVFLCVVLTVIDIRHFLLPDLFTLPGLAMGIVFALGRGLAATTAGRGSWIGGFLDAEILPLAALGGAALGAAVPLAARAGYMLMRRLRGSGDIEPAEDPGGADDDVFEAAAEEGMGLGDVKMLAKAGAFLGPRMIMVAILLGSVGGCLLVLPWLGLSRRSFKTPVPFGPFIAAGVVAAAFAGEDLSSWYSNWIVTLFQ